MKCLQNSRHVAGVLALLLLSNITPVKATQNNALPKCNKSGKISESWSGEIMLLDKDSGWIIGYYHDIDLSLNNISLDQSYSPRLKLSFRIDADGSVGRTEGYMLLGTATGQLSNNFISDWRYTYSYDGVEETYEPINMKISTCDPICSKLGSGIGDVTRETLRTEVAVPFKASAINLHQDGEEFSVTADLSGWPQVHDILMPALEQALAKYAAGECRRW